MPCYHPLKAFNVGVKPNGKKEIKVCSYDVDHLEKVGQSWLAQTDPMARSSLAKKIVTEFDEIPCGHCIGCRLAYSRRWADRMMLELQYHKRNSFLTLTYDNDHVPKSSYVDNVGQVHTSYTLDKRDHQLFWKRFRKECGSDIRFFGCGEYG